MIVNNANLRSLFISHSTAFQGGFAGVTPTYQRVAMTVPSSTRANEYGWLKDMPRIREWIGDRVVESLETAGYLIRNRSFESTISVSRPDIEDDNVGVYAPIFTDFGRSSASFPDELVWPAMQAGFSTPCYDGQFFFDTDHPVLDANGQITSVANTDGGTGAPWFLIDDSRSFRPIIYQTRKPFKLTRMDADTDEAVFNRNEFRYGIDGRCNVGYGFWQLAWGSKQPLDATRYEAARVGLGKIRGDRGRPLGIVPRLLVCGPSLEGAARALLNNEMLPGGGTNQWKGTAELLVVPWLD
ncbi:Mu-like prophage major head subunit gpT family protein [Methylobacterium sp. Leaf85]|uniref:Mu-like prophage major head subunit gpT family protein n=1 Tax=Methylobacterium sp. Leaf85 TaxID=1736241 RepID=UPI0006F278CD|nr:Mu-like prophage major head subunit gpT family protein [Methylobacterium sp. Leaf85]KQO53077.1 hypothetical protein ASF08_19320 [Methylobacterium sp. Leaf85]